MQSNAPVITGIGLVSALGFDERFVWQSLINGASGLRQLTRFQSQRCENLPVAEAVFPPGMRRFGARAKTMAVLAARHALGSASLLTATNKQRARIGVVLGATTGGMPESETFADQLWKKNNFDPACFRSHEPAAAADACARIFGLTGPCVTVSTACSSGAMALLLAAQWLNANEADIVLAGGVDPLCRLTLNGFASLLLIDPQGCRPFDANRAGMTLGEASVFIVLEQPEIARRRNAPIRAVLSGCGATCDAHHVTTPDPTGRGAAAAIRMAIEQAGLTPSDIGYINAHGTATHDNDLAESIAIRSVFDRHLPPISSTKRAFGHTLAAAGALEAAICVLTLQNGILPPNTGFLTPDEKIGFVPLTKPKQTRINHILSNSFGFGGNNVCLAISSTPALRAARTSRKVSGAGARQIDIAAISFLSPAGNDFIAMKKTATTGLSPAWQEIQPPLPGHAAPVFACNDADIAEELDPVRHRRLTRMLQWTVACGRRCRSRLPREFAQPNSERICVTLGTGLGSMEDTDRFIVNMIRRDEQAPMPASFIQSVHNAPAARLALELQARGVNSTLVHREIACEAAICQATKELLGNRHELAYAGAMDELNPYLLALGRHMDWWPRQNPSPQHSIHNNPSFIFKQPPCGEAMALAALMPSGHISKPLARIEASAIGRFAGNTSANIDPCEEAKWLRLVLSQNDIDPNDIDFVLTGAGGWRAFDPIYAAVTDAWQSLTGRNCLVGAYKHICGEFNSASAIGMVVAIGLLNGELPVAAFCRNPNASHMPKPKKILIYTLARSGNRGMMALSS